MELLYSKNVIFSYFFVAFFVGFLQIIIVINLLKIFGNLLSNTECPLHQALLQYII